tara:strand:+ start:675 stop:1280 length:606 start_codon:yes stop_codon:yes gene_type:complete
MSDDEMAITHHSGDNINPAKMAVQENSGHWPIPEGAILARATTRAFAYIMDTIFVMGVLYLLTSILGGQAASIVQAYNIGLLFSGGRGTVLFIVNWFLIFGGNYLYHKYTGIRFARTLSQRWMGLAVVREDGAALTRLEWDKRALRKIKYAIPVVGLLIFGIKDILLIQKRHTHQSSIDLAVGSIVVDGNSLSPSNRKHLR